MHGAQKPIIVLDFGAQYSKLIARRVREARVFSVILPYNTDLATIQGHDPAGIILSGGPASVHSPGAPVPDPGVLALGVPVLGICYGLQVIAQMLGGAVERSAKREYGIAHIEQLQSSSLLESVEPRSQVWMSHGDGVVSLPDGFQTLARTENCAHAAVVHPERALYGVQFHPEVVHTHQGSQMLANFVHRICRCGTDWDMGSFADASIAAIREQVGDGRVVCGLSGGVDSSVAAVLIHRAIGDRLTCVFVNNGLLRKGEPELVQSVFRDNFHIDLRYVDAEDRFL